MIEFVVAGTGSRPRLTTYSAPIILGLMALTSCIDREAAYTIKEMEVYGDVVPPKAELMAFITIVRSLSEDSFGHQRLPIAIEFFVGESFWCGGDEVWGCTLLPSRIVQVATRSLPICLARTSLAHEFMHLWLFDNNLHDANHERTDLFKDTVQEVRDLTEGDCE